MYFSLWSDSTNPPMSFNGGILAFYIICFILYGCLFMLGYTYYINNKFKYYQKIKTKLSTIFLLILLSAIFITLALFVTIISLNKINNYLKNNMYMIPLSWILFAFSLIHMIGQLVINHFINKKRLVIDNFMEEDFNKLSNDLLSKKPNDRWLNKWKNKNKRYISIIDQKYEIINSMLDKYTKDQYQAILVNIIMFNEQNVWRWSKKGNFYQVEKWLNLCINLQMKNKLFKTF